MPAFKGAVLVDQYCNPLTDVTLESISAQLDDITEKVKKNLRVKNVSHPSLRSGQGKPVYQECLGTSAMLAKKKCIVIHVECLYALLRIRMKLTALQKSKTQLGVLHSKPTAAEARCVIRNDPRSAWIHMCMPFNLMLFIHKLSSNRMCQDVLVDEHLSLGLRMGIGCGFVTCVRVRSVARVRASAPGPLRPQRGPVRAAAV